MSACCRINESSPSASEECPTCGLPGRTVGHVTLEALLTAAASRRGIPPAARSCLTASCPVVYFDNAASIVLDENDLSVPVHAKHVDDAAIPICYCFDVNRARIEDEILANGFSTLSGMIAEEIRAGQCACEVRNPKGACCLGDIRRAEREAEARLPAANEGR